MGPGCHKCRLVATLRFRQVATRQIGASSRRFPSLFDAGCESSRAATHVDAYEGVLSDAGSTPAASTTQLILPRGRNDLGRPRLHNVSKIFRFSPLIEQPNRAPEIGPRRRDGFLGCRAPPGGCGPQPRQFLPLRRREAGAAVRPIRARSTMKWLPLSSTKCERWSDRQSIQTA
jgi:hypothetical protein